MALRLIKRQWEVVNHTLKGGVALVVLRRLLIAAGRIDEGLGLTTSVDCLAVQNFECVFHVLFVGLL